MDDWTCEAIENCSSEDAKDTENPEDTEAEDPSSNAATATVDAIAPSKRPRSESNGSSDKPASDGTNTKPTQFCHNMRFVTWGSDGLVK